MNDGKTEVRIIRLPTSERAAAIKVPAVTLAFWITKVLATTLGETGGDTLSMTLGLGYFVSSAIFIAALALLVSAQISASGYKPWLYWTTIVASTMAGTTMADFVTRSMGVGYEGGSLLLFAAVMASLAVWRVTLGTVALSSVVNWKAEGFYWLTITFSQTLGTALGDWTADVPGVGYTGAALIFGGAILLLPFLLVLAIGAVRIRRTMLFWSIFILSRPFGAAVGDFLDKPIAKGGLAFARPEASAVLALSINALVALLPQRFWRTSSL